MSHKSLNKSVYSSAHFWKICSGPAHTQNKCASFAAQLCPMFSKVANRKGTSWLHNPSLSPLAAWSPCPTLVRLPWGWRLTLLWSLFLVTCGFSQCTEDPRSVTHSCECLVWSLLLCALFFSSLMHACVQPLSPFSWTAAELPSFCWRAFWWSDSNAS